MNKIILATVAALLLIGISFIFFGGSGNKSGINKGETVQNVEIKDGIQYITINAKGGYFPKVSNAEAGIPTKLIVKTNGTYDCSSSLVVRSANYQKILSQTGEEIIDLGIPESGKPLQGMCGMGMYNFSINFN